MRSKLKIGAGKKTRGNRNAMQKKQAGQGFLKEIQKYAKKCQKTP